MVVTQENIFLIKLNNKNPVQKYISTDNIKKIL